MIGVAVSISDALREISGLSNRHGDVNESCKGNGLVLGFRWRDANSSDLSWLESRALRGAGADVLTSDKLSRTMMASSNPEPMDLDEPSEQSMGVVTPAPALKRKQDDKDNNAILFEALDGPVHTICFECHGRWQVDTVISEMDANGVCYVHVALVKHEKGRQSAKSDQRFRYTETGDSAYFRADCCDAIEDLVAAYRKGSGFYHIPRTEYRQQHGRYALATGLKNTCLPDALYNAAQLMMHTPFTALQCRDAVMPADGSDATIVETQRFAQAHGMQMPSDTRFNKMGGPAFNLLQATSGAFIVFVRISAAGQTDKHAFAYNAVAGTILDNYQFKGVLAVEACDRISRPSARAVIDSMFPAAKKVRIESVHRLEPIQCTNV